MIEPEFKAGDRSVSHSSLRRDPCCFAPLTFCVCVASSLSEQSSASLTIPATTSSTLLSQCKMRAIRSALRAAVVGMIAAPLLMIAAATAVAAAPAAALPREVHAFFYLWYGVPAVDGRYLHWDHEILQHWTPAVAAQWPKGKFEPPGDVGATFMPARGLYSSNDPETLRSQMNEARAAGIDVIVASWWPANRPDGQGVDTDRCVPALLDAAASAGIKVAFHIEPYTDRTPLTVRGDLEYLSSHYGQHPALHRFPRPSTGQMLPIVYIYDSYINPAAEWAEILSSTGAHTIRGTASDHVVIGLFLHADSRAFLRSGHFDGSYSYFAASGSSFGSTPGNWARIAREAQEDGLMFIPSVGPGYDDTRIRPWNGANKRGREEGRYYQRMWEAAKQIAAATSSSSSIVSITSLNEWGEGTQIEPAAAFTTEKGEKLQEYTPDGPAMYMDLTRKFAAEFKQIAATQPVAEEAHAEL